MARKGTFYNVVTFGHTGSGKSSVVNYMLGKKVAKTGVGSPVTDGFECHKAVVNRLPINICDSRGCEINRVEQWVKEMRAFLEKHRGDRPPQEWLHTVLYCINAAGSRVEDFHIEDLQRLQRQNEAAIVVFTKCDAVDATDIERMRDVIRKRLGAGVPVVGVNSVLRKIKTRSGKVEPIDPFGKERLIEEIVRAFWRTIEAKAPGLIRKEVLADIDKKCDAWIKTANTGGAASFDRVREAAARYADNLPKTIATTIESVVNRVTKMYGDFADLLDYPTPEDLPPPGAFEWTSHWTVKLRKIILNISNTILASIAEFLLHIAEWFRGAYARRAIISAIENYRKALYVYIDDCQEVIETGLKEMLRNDRALP